MPDPCQVCDLHHGSWQRLILNPLKESRDQTHILMDTSLVRNPLSHSRNSYDTDIFEEFRLVILESIPQFGFAQCFLIIRPRKQEFSRSDVEFSEHGIRWHMLSIVPFMAMLPLITGSDDTYHVSPRICRVMLLYFSL